jgi:hypothetical protein
LKAHETSIPSSSANISWTAQSKYQLETNNKVSLEAKSTKENLTKVELEAQQCKNSPEASLNAQCFNKNNQCFL